MDWCLTTSICSSHLAGNACRFSGQPLNLSTRNRLRLGYKLFGRSRSRQTRSRRLDCRAATSGRVPPLGDEDAMPKSRRRGNGLFSGRGFGQNESASGGSGPGWDDWLGEWGDPSGMPSSSSEAAPAPGTAKNTYSTDRIQPAPEKPNEPPRRRRKRLQEVIQVRDEYLRPIIDWTGAKLRLDPNATRAQAALEDEYLGNEEESQDGAKWAFWNIFLIPILAGWLVSRLAANPVLEFVQENNENAFAVTRRQKIAGALKVKQEELRLRMEAAIGRAPPLTDSELFAFLRHEALEVKEEMENENRFGLVSLISDSVTFGIIIRNCVAVSEGRDALLGTIYRIWGGMSDTAQAFLIILVTDTLLGYHSEGTWDALVDAVAEHYAWQLGEGPIIIFICIFPVTMDAVFKYWIFTKLNRTNPAAAVTISEIDRH